MSTIKQTILKEIQSAIDVPMMDVKNISNLILDDYVRENRLTYWKSYPGFYAISVGGVLGYIPDDDSELFERVRELVNLGWTNKDRSIRLDISSWRTQRQAIRAKIFSL